MKGRRSSRVQLVALGTVIVGGCSGNDVPDNRFAYPNRPACVTEWGEKNCSSSGYFSSGGVGLGPRYGSWVNLPTGEKIWSGTPRTPSFHPQTGKHLGAGALSVSRGGSGGVGTSGSTARGGFGSSGHAFSSGS
ncbi:MAG: hypothetical protein EXR28_10555 [Betaproteobacteria bacterium]|nr:hypothetical protein [Betaproteobacteria bacterium]